VNPINLEHFLSVANNGDDLIPKIPTELGEDRRVGVALLGTAHPTIRSSAFDLQTLHQAYPLILQPTQHADQYDSF